MKDFDDLTDADARIVALHDELGIPGDYGTEPPRPLYAEATDLIEAGPNIIGRMQRLAPPALEAWQSMQRQAGADGIDLLLVSGFRAYDYQADLIRNKLARGEELAAILEVNAAPGYSQHHTGLALDIAAPGARPLTEEFEHSPAFEWLARQAADFGFRMSYPRGNPEGFVYEPWHWALL